MLISSIATSDSSAVVEASEWIAGLLTGSLATGIAVIAIAAVGFGMLGGRIDLRRGASAILGCFLLFGAPAIAEALSSLSRSEVSAAPDAAPPPSAGPAPNAPPQQDPYAGASLIQ